MSDEKKPREKDFFGMTMPLESVQRVRWAFLWSAVPVYEIDDPVYPNPRWRALVKNPKAEWVAIFSKKIKEKNPDWETKISEFIAVVPDIERHEIEDGATAFAGGPFVVAA